MKSLDLRVEMIENQHEWRKIIHVKTIGMVHVAVTNLLKLRL